MVDDAAKLNLSQSGQDMAGETSEPSPLAEKLDALAAEFVDRLRRGERPDVAQYAAHNPALAQEIRDLFPALLMMERVRPASSDFPVALPESWSADSKPDSLGDFRILREVGRGGMGIVYEAEQISLGRHVALKVLPRHATLEQRQLRRFQQEARAAARLHHTNIVPVFGVGQQDGLHYYTMQFIHGIALDEVLVELRELARHRTERSSETAPPSPPDMSAAWAAESLFTNGSFQASDLERTPESAGSDGMPAPSSDRDPDPSPTTGHRPTDGSSGNCGGLSGSSQENLRDRRRWQYWKSVARIGAQCADAIAYAHEQHVLHRDIKPANLLLDSRGNIWVTDFGLARSVGADDLTRSGDIVGTLRYMSPEQLEGRTDARSDIYSLGITLYEMLALESPFSAEDRGGLIRQIMAGVSRNPRKLDARIPVDLETIVLKATSLSPADRYQHASDLAADLRRFLDDRPVSARQIRWDERIRRWCRRNPVVASLLVVVSLLALGLTTSLGLAQLVRAQRDAAVASRIRAEEAEANLQATLGRAVNAEREATILTHLAKARSWRNSRQVGQRTLPLEEIRKAAVLQPTPEIAAELQNTAIEALTRADLIDVSSRSIPNQSAAQVDPRRSRYAILDLLGSRTLTVFNMADDRVQAQLPVPDLNIWHGTVDWTPDGGKLIVAYSLRNRDDDLLQVWDIDRKEKILELPFSCEMVPSPIGVEPSGRFLAVPTVERDIAIWDLVDVREVRRIPCGIRDTIRVQLDRTGQRLAVTGFSGESPAAIFDFATGQRLLKSWKLPARGPAAFSPGGRLIAVGAGDPAQLGNIIVWDVAEERIVSTLEGHAEMIIFLQFFHRDELVVSCSWDETCRLWDVRSGECLLTFSGAVLSLGEGGSQLALQRGNELVIAELSTSEICQRLSVTGAGNRASGLQPLSVTCGFNQSNELAFGCDSQGVWIWDIHRGAQIAALPIGPTTNVLVHRSGTALVTAGDAGIFRWPISRSEETGLIRWTLGPPVWLRNAADIRMKCVTWLNDERQLAFSEWGNDQVVIIDADPNDGIDCPEGRLTSDHRRISNLAASPDGRWLAASGWMEGYVQVWDATRPSSPMRLPHSDGTGDTLFHVQFSPDNRRLACVASNLDAAGLYLYETATWKRLSVVLGPTRPIISFSPDGALACRQDGEFEQLILVAGSSGEELARLPSPRQVHKHHEFSHDGRSLVFLSDRNSLDVIRLDRIGEHLRDLGLPWAIEVPPSPKATPRAHEITVDLGTVAEDYASIMALRDARRLAQVARDAQFAKDWKLAIESFATSVELTPDDPTILNNYAWLLATCPDEAHRNASLALDLSQRVVSTEEDSAVFLNTLGVAQYRNGLYFEAIATLHRAEDLEPGAHLAFNGFFLAMAYQHTGEREKAQEWFRRSDQWMQHGWQTDPELIQFHREASMLLALPQPPTASDGPSAN